MLEKRPPPSEGTVAAAVVVVEPPRPKAKPAVAGCCGAVEVRTEPNVKPAPAGADEVVEVLVREKGVADAVGLLKAKLKPVEAAVDAGAPMIMNIQNLITVTYFHRFKVESTSRMNPVTQTYPM